jgi:hypothetical protein
MVNGQYHRKSAKRKRVSPKVSQSKILRRSTGGKPSKILHYCPVITCPHRKDSSGNKSYLLRHVQSARPECDTSRLENGRQISISITRGDYFRKHIRQKNLYSIHAKILDAVLLKTRITLPSPPSVAEYTADFETAVT